MPRFLVSLCVPGWVGAITREHRKVTAEPLPCFGLRFRSRCQPSCSCGSPQHHAPMPHVLRGPGGQAQRDRHAPAQGLMAEVITGYTRLLKEGLLRRRCLEVGEKQNKRPDPPYCIGFCNFSAWNHMAKGFGVEADLSQRKGYLFPLFQASPGGSLPPHSRRGTFF